MNIRVFLTACLFWAVSSVVANISPEYAVPDPPDVAKLNTQPWVPARYKVVREQLMGKECGVLFVGDSITQGWERRVRTFGRNCFYR